MGIAEIIILIVGAILFTVSFFIPERNVDTKENRELEERIVREVVGQEIAKYKYKMEESAEESIANTKDTAERYMDRITNEKMTAISEYSDTVMEQIHKNHEEAMFLYDMLNNKHAQVKNTAVELNQLAKIVKQIPNMDHRVENKEVIQTESKTITPAVTPTSQMIQQKHFEPIQPEHIILPDTKSASVSTKADTKKKEKAKKETPVRNKKVEVVFDSDNGGMNSNDRILTLHKAGKSNMAIAKELGLGIGEVKLVIDLFEGI